MFGGANHLGNNGSGSSPASSSNNNNNSNTAQGALANARQLMSRGEYYNAISALDTVAANGNLGNAIERERIFIIRAECFLGVKQFGKAEKEARAAMGVSLGSSPQAQFVLGSALLGQFRIQEAVDAFDVAETMMNSPQPWKYVVLPEDEAKSNTSSVAHAQQRATTAAAAAAADDGPSPRRERGIELVPRRYRDIGVDDPTLVPERERLTPAAAAAAARAPPAAAAAQSNNNNDKKKTSTSALEFRPPLLPPPPVTYEWTNAFNAYKSDANLARKLDTAQTTRLLPRSGLVSGLRMLEQLSKKKASKFLIISLRNDTDYELVYQFHTCGSEDSEAYHSRNASGGPPPPSNTQYFIKFPHVIPPGMIGVAVIYSDSWRAKMITISAAVCFAMRRTKEQEEAAAEREARRKGKEATQSTTAGAADASSKQQQHQQKQIPSPLVRFSFALSVMNNVTASTSVSGGSSPSPTTAGATAAAAASRSPQKSTSSASNDKKEKDEPKSAPNFAAFNFDRHAFAAFAHNSFPSLNYSRQATAGTVAGTQSDVVVSIPAAFLSVVQKPAGLKTQQGSTSRMSPVLVGCVAQFMPARPLRVAAVVSTTWRSVASSLPPARFDDGQYGATMPDYLLARDLRCSPFTVRNELSPQQIQNFLIKQQQQQQQQGERDDPQNGGHHQQPSPKGSPSQKMPPLVQWSVKREDGNLFRILVFRNRRNEPTLQIAGDRERGNDYFVRLPGGNFGRSLLGRVTSTTGFFGGSRTANMLWTSPYATPNETELTTRLAGKIYQETATDKGNGGGGTMTYSVCPTALQTAAGNSSSGAADNGGKDNRSGWELTVPHPLGRTPLSVPIRDIATKSTVAKLEFDSGAYLLKFYQPTDAMWCAVLISEYLVAW